jgi:purine-nucleoside phosphorylase
VSIVNFYGNIVFDTLVKPCRYHSDITKVVYYREWITGIKPCDLEHAPTFGNIEPIVRVINVENACSESTYAKFAFDIDGDIIPHQGNCYDIINDTAKTLNQSILCGNVHSSDVFYRKNPGLPAIVSAHNCLAVEMEAFALFANAKTLGKKAATLLTISDVIPTHEQISADERERSLNPMIELALNAGIQMV